MNEVKAQNIRNMEFIYKELDTTEWLALFGLLDSSVGKESACDTREPSSIPGLRRAAGEGIGYPLQFS